MNVIDIQDRPTYFPNLVVGLEWHSIPLKEQRLYTRKMRATGYKTVVAAAGKDAVNIGQIERVCIPHYGKSVSLAAWVANSFKQGTVVACEKVKQETTTGKELYWLVIVNDGQIVAGTDVIGTWDLVVEKARELLSILGVTDAGYIGSHGSKLPTNFSSRDTLTLQDALLKGTIRRSLISQDPANSKLIPIVAAGVLASCIVLGVGGSWAYSAYEEAKAIEQAEKARIARVNRAEQDWLAFAGNIFNEVPAAESIRNLWGSVLSGLPEHVGGWKLTDIECSIDECRSEYRNEDFTPTTLFSERMAGNCSSVSYQENNREVLCVSAVEKRIVPEPLEIDDAVQRLEQSSMTSEQLTGFVSELMTVFHLMGRDQLTISNSASIKSRAQQLVPGVPEVAQGGWRIEVPLEHVPMLTNLFAKYPGLTLVELNIQGSNKITQISGHYFTKVAQQ